MTGGKNGTEDGEPDIASPWDGILFGGFVGWFFTYPDGLMVTVIGVIAGAFLLGTASAIYNRVS